MHSSACRMTASTFRQWLIFLNVTGLETTWKRSKERWECWNLSRVYKWRHVPGNQREKWMSPVSPLLVDTQWSIKLWESGIVLTSKGLRKTSQAWLISEWYWFVQISEKYTKGMMLVGHINEQDFDIGSHRKSRRKSPLYMFQRLIMQIWIDIDL